jgi:hypothetical protein
MVNPEIVDPEIGACLDLKQFWALPAVRGASRCLFSGWRLDPGCSFNGIVSE